MRVRLLFVLVSLLASPIGVRAYCGDGTVDGGEACDTAGPSATCDYDCTFVSCGDSIANPSAGEQCDTGGASSYCDADCSVARCGDGTVNNAAGEACDDADASATCDADCTLPVCGDATLNFASGEQCDDGNQVPGDGCSEICLYSCQPQAPALPDWAANAVAVALLLTGTAAMRWRRDREA